MVEETAKKFAVGDISNSPTNNNNTIHTTTTNTHKKPTRHHVKRRSSGRVHVTKLAPMTRALSQAATEEDTNLSDGQQQQVQQPQRKPMKRSHSSKSIHRLSSNDAHRKVNLTGFTMTSKSTSTSNNNNASSPTSSNSNNTTITQQPQKEEDKNITEEIKEQIKPSNNNNNQSLPTSTSSTTMNKNRTKNNKKNESSIISMTNTTESTSKSKNHHFSSSSSNPSFHVSHQSPAAPIASMLSATANTLVSSDKPIISNLTSTKKVHSLNDNDNNDHHSMIHNNNQSIGKPANHISSYSKFIRQENSYEKDDKSTSSASSTSLNEDEIIDTSFGLMIEKMDKEYEYIQKYHDPMISSLARCMEQKRLQAKPTSTQKQLHRLAQLGSQNKTHSSSILPTMSTLTSSASSPSPIQASMSTPSHHLQHIEHRQLAKLRHQRLLQSNHPSSIHSSYSSDNKQTNSRWSAGAFLDRMFYGTS